VEHPLAVNKSRNPIEEHKKKIQQEQQTEALFLRKPILVQNDLYSKGDDIIVGYEGINYRMMMFFMM